MYYIMMEKIFVEKLFLINSTFFLFKIINYFLEKNIIILLFQIFLYRKKMYTVKPKRGRMWWSYEKSYLWIIMT